MYQVMYYVGLSGTVIFFLLSVILFFKKDIAKLLGDVTGWNARHAIKKENIQMKETAIEGSFQTDAPVKPKRPRKRKKQDRVTQLLVREENTEHLQEDEETALLSEEEATTLLAENEITDVLSEEEATILLHTEEATELLHTEEATELLYTEEATELLYTEEATELLYTEEATELLHTEEATELLQVQDEPTDILYEDINISTEDGGSILDDAVESENLIGDENSTVILSQKEQPMPDIFEVEEDTTVIHTEESI